MNNLTRQSLLLVQLLVLGISSGHANDGKTIPKPVFQLGDEPSRPLPDGSTEAQGFLDFYNKTYLKDDTPIPMRTKKQVVWFPPQNVGDTSLETVVRSTQGNPPNCDPGDEAFPPTGYPLVCEVDSKTGEGDFSTGEFCKACHDSALFVDGGGLPEMMYVDEHKQWLTNWSQYGDWSANIMRLATRDPIWQAQIETETNKHPFADPAVIQDVCFSCHGEMGERQLKVDHGLDQTFCTDMFYAILPGILPDTPPYIDSHTDTDKDNRPDHTSTGAGGERYAFTGDCSMPIDNKSVEEHPNVYAKYGALARDGVSCETCHRIGPENGNGNWDGKDFEVFYGAKHANQVHKRQTSNLFPLEYDFTATFQYDMKNIMTPDPLGPPGSSNVVESATMMTYDNLTIAHAKNTKNNISYLKQSVLCGTCHLLIVPQIPSAFEPDKPLPDTSEDLIKKYPYYKRPDSCVADTFAAATRKNYGNPVTDLCVALGYEQTTYLEWINSEFASEQDNEHTCQGCHMPLVTHPDQPANHTAIMAQAPPNLPPMENPALTPKNYRRHRLMGINLPVLEMFIQFPDVLGVTPYSDNVPNTALLKSDDSEELIPVIQNYLLNGQMAIVEQATSQANGNGLKKDSSMPDAQAAAEIVINTSAISNSEIIADLTIVNNTGHKFPSGAGFRRAFIKFEVLDGSGNVLWVSGQTNAYGAICNGTCSTGSNSYNILASENPQGKAENLQPHHAIVYSQDQVQIYEVNVVNDTGLLTSRTLSLFHDAKDNRLLPRGYKSKEELKCTDPTPVDATIFGIRQCSAFYATEPQLEPLTVGSAISSDPHYMDSKLAGSDSIRYEIPLGVLKEGRPASIRVSLEYQTIPPAFLADRFKDGFDQKNGNFLPATERSIYLTSHLNTNLGLTSENPDNKNLIFSQNWTTTIYQAKADLSPSAAPMDAVLLTPAYPSVLDKTVRHGAALPYVFFERKDISFRYSGSGNVWLASNIEGTGKTFVDDAVEIVITDTKRGKVETFSFDYSKRGNGITPEEPMNLTNKFNGPGDYLITLRFQDRIPAYLGASNFYLVPKP